MSSSRSDSVYFVFSLFNLTVGGGSWWLCKLSDLDVDLGKFEDEDDTDNDEDEKLSESNSSSSEQCSKIFLHFWQ